METGSPKSARWETVNGVRVMVCAAEGTKLRTDRDAVELIGEALSQKVGLVAIPVERLEEDFFRLKTRMAGEFLQKFVQYGVRVAIVGDISRYMEESEALRDFVRESNRGKHISFVANADEMGKRLGQQWEA
jgi:hypothetical protein